MQQSNSANITQLPAFTNSIRSQQLSAQSRDKLTIMQWNTNGIRTKLLELRDRLFNSDVDIVAIQESKLCKEDKTPLIEGYTTIRKGRNNFLGGGLLFFVRNVVIFKKIYSFERAGMEILPV